MRSPYLEQYRGVPESLERPAIPMNDLSRDRAGSLVVGQRYVFARRYVLSENGVPDITTIGTDAAVAATITLTASGTQGIAISITTAGAVFGSVVVC